MNRKHDKAKVLEIGFQLFWLKGYNNLGVNEICQTTGMTKGAFYNAFKSKENFLVSAIHTYGEMNVCHLGDRLNNFEINSVERLINMYTDMFESQPGKNFKGCLINNTMSEMASSNPIVGAATTEVFESLLDVIEPVVQEAQKEGDLDPSINSRLLTELIHTTFFGALTRAKSTKDYKHGIETMSALIHSFKHKSK